MLLDVVDIIGFMSTKEVCVRIHYGFEPCLFLIPGFLFDALMIGIVFCINSVIFGFVLILARFIWALGFPT